MNEQGNDFWHMLHLCHIALTEITIGVSGSEVSVVKTTHVPAECEQKWLALFPLLDISNLSQSSGVSRHLLVSDRNVLVHRLQKSPRLVS